MNTKLLFSTLICSLCFAVTAQTNAKTTVDAQTQKYQQVCKGKKQGDMISFAYKGVVFNGTCEPNEAGKLAFQPPMPANNAMPETQTKISETQSEPRPVSAPVQPMEMTPPPVEQSTPQIEQTAP
jgi:hypothetical protein